MTSSDRSGVEPTPEPPTQPFPAPYPSVGAPPPAVPAPAPVPPPPPPQSPGAAYAPAPAGSYAQQPPAPPYPPQPPAPPYPPQPTAAPYPPGVAGPAYPPPGLSAGVPVPTPPPPKRRSPWKILVGVAVTVLVICGVVAVKTAGRFFIESGVDEVIDTGAPAPKTPFEGSLAESFPLGEAGIVVPSTSEVTGFTSEQVAASLVKVKEALIASRLDPTMLVEHDTTAFIGLLAPGVQEDIRQYFDAKDFMHFATQIAPGYTLTSDPIRVKGEMTFGPRVIEDLPFLEVKTNFVWVYPFTGELREPGDHLVVIHDEISWVFPRAEDVLDEYIGMWLDTTQSYSSNIDCDLAEQSLLALGKPRLSVGADTGDESEVFDPSGSLDLGDTC